MPDREKLRALIDKARYGAAEMCHKNGCKGCPHWDDRPHCRNSFIADHLIANGVTVQKHGRWEFKGTAYACSECGTGFPAPVSYCFGCGAKMSGGEDAEKEES